MRRSAPGRELGGSCHVLALALVRPQGSRLNLTRLCRGVKMRLPSVVPSEGTALVNAIDALRAVGYSLQEVQYASPGDPLVAYQRWSNEAARRLSYSFDSEAVEVLILSRRHWALQAVFSSGVGDVRNLVQAEVEDRRRVLDALLEIYQRIEGQWPAADLALRRRCESRSLGSGGCPGVRAGCAACRHRRFPRRRG